MKKNSTIFIVTLIALLLTSCKGTPSKKKKSSSYGGSETTAITSDSGNQSTNVNPTSANPSSGSSTSKPSTTSLSPDVESYYDEIDDSLSGTDLLNALRDLNEKYKEREVGYSSMGTSASGAFKYTDYDPSSVRYDENGQPYGTLIVSFYSGNTMTSFNREHVWPNTHGGSLVEHDIHMPRPTIPAENGSRGHSFYVEGMKSKKNEGWDPAMEDFGKEDYRGDSARIIFYCMIATKNLVLVDDQSRSSMTKNNEMGVISDMLSWNERYPVLEREQRRNAGAQYLQGNRNPFIDHPEYACKIWGATNDKTRAACGLS